MKRTVACLVVLLAGCSVNSSPEEAAQVRQPLPGLPNIPEHLGRQAGAQLGTSVAGCQVPGFAAGAPGENATYVFTDAGTWFAAPFTPDGGHGVGNAVACMGGPTNLKVVTAGIRGAWLLPTGVLTSSGSVQTLERGSGAAASALLVGKPASGTVEIFTLTLGTLLPQISPLSMTTGAGSAFVWDPLGTFFVVGDPIADSAQFYGWTAGVPSMGPTLTGPSSSGFGSALAIGDVHPNPGRELIVGAPWSGQVFIYTLPPSSLLMVLDWPDPNSAGSFGTALTVEPSSVVTTGTLQALWVGDPTNARVMRFIGDAGQVLSAQANSYFGYSLAVTEQKLIVGAPFFTEVETNQGAVYSLPFGTVPVPNSEPRPCFGGGCITSDCDLGRCVGGVICQSTLNPICVGGTCNNGNCTLPPDAGGRPDGGGRPDAGEFDAGEPDAGEPDAGGPDAGGPDAGGPDAGGSDAGAPDAGAPDAGAPDAGPDAGSSDAGKPGEPKDAGTDIEAYGTSCGCSGGAGVLPLWLLSLLWSRRRVTVGLPSPRPSPSQGEGGTC